MLGELAKVAMVEQSPYAEELTQRFLDLVSVPRDPSDVMSPGKSRPVQMEPSLLPSVPSESAVSRTTMRVALSKPVEKDGFTFVGTFQTMKDVEKIHANDVNKSSLIGGFPRQKIEKDKDRHPLIYLVYAHLRQEYSQQAF
eukprot:scaffold2149_cov172-Amphora_coffeaeformis.AAC.1